MQEKLVSRAKELLSDGTVVRVLGWRKGDTDFSAEPAFFESAESLDEFTYDGFCGANLSKYMIKAIEMKYNGYSFRSRTEAKSYKF